MHQTSVAPGVFELRDQDDRAWYRVIYLLRVRNVIHVLHCFEKKSRETPLMEINTATAPQGSSCQADEGEETWQVNEISRLT